MQSRNLWRQEKEKNLTSQANYQSGHANVRIAKNPLHQKKYHDTYVQCKHGSDVNFKSKPVSTPSSTESEEISYDEYTLVLDDPGVVDTREDELAKPENRRGSSQ